MRLGVVVAAVLGLATVVVIGARSVGGKRATTSRGTPASEQAGAAVGVGAAAGAGPTARVGSGAGRDVGARLGAGAGPGAGVGVGAGLGEGASADAGDTLALVRAAIADGSPESTRTLVRALDGDDDVAKIAAIDELVKRRHVGALPKLVAFDPGADPFVAPTAILGLGKLARDADAEAQEAAVQRLAKILEEEKARQGTDSPGNILTAFEALGEIRVPSAARVLERELLAAEHGIAAKVAVVDALEACAQPSTVPVLTAFRGAFQPSATDAFERELEADLVTALTRAIATLSRAR